MEALGRRTNDRAPRAASQKRPAARHRNRVKEVMRIRAVHRAPQGHHITAGRVRIAILAWIVGGPALMRKLHHRRES
jgi:hypothetical protein